MNVTPLVDVILILLIVFLLTADTTRGIVLDLPEAGTGEAIPTEAWEVAITADARVLSNGVEIEAENLRSVLQAARRRAPTVDAFVDVMDAIRQTGFYNLVIATEPKATRADDRNP